MVAIVTHVDDLDLAADPRHQVPADETLAFAFEGNAYTIDLTTRHADEFRQAMTRYIAAASPASDDPAPQKKRSHTTSAGDTPLKQARRHRMRQRAFAMSRPDLGEKSFTTESGHWSYTDRLEKEYAAYVAEHGEYPLPGEPGGSAL